MRFANILLLSGAVILSACEKPNFTEAMVLGGETISAEALNGGLRHYMQNCYACHGEEGNGRGPASAYLRPPPRDFRSGVFKFSLSYDGLPHTKDLVALVQRGLTGTAMLPWDVPESQLIDIINYIKTFSGAWSCVKSSECDEEECARTDAEGKVITDEDGDVDCYEPKEAGTRVVAVDDNGKDLDPWQGRKQAAIDRGKTIYHINAQCRTCHPAYITQQELHQLSKTEGRGYAKMAYRPLLRKSDVYKTNILPIDFLFHPIKNLSDKVDEVAQRRMLFRVIGSGIGGTAMPKWKDSITDEELWALVYYTQYLSSMRGTQAATELRAALEDPAQQAWTPDGSAPAPDPTPTPQNDPG